MPDANLPRSSPSVRQVCGREDEKQMKLADRHLAALSELGHVDGQAERGSRDGGQGAVDTDGYCRECFGAG